MIRMEMLLIHDDHNDHDEDDDGFQRMIVPDNVLQSDRRSPQQTQTPNLQLARPQCQIRVMCSQNATNTTLSTPMNKDRHPNLASMQQFTLYLVYHSTLQCYTIYYIIVYYNYSTLQFVIVCYSIIVY